MKNIEKAMNNLSHIIREWGTQTPIPFEEFLEVAASIPSIVIRNIFQIFHDMVYHYVEKGVDEYPDDPESINYINYDFGKIFSNDSGTPFFADRLFANRFMDLADSMKSGAQQNKIYIFKGPPGCGKSTFLNNLLLKFEEYANTEQGMRYEILWRLDRKRLGGFIPEPAIGVENGSRDYWEVPCPSHDNPLLMVPLEHRKAFFDDLLENDEFKWKLFTDKEYDWVFTDEPCTICSALYNSLLYKLKSPKEVFKMIYARPYEFNRRLGEGISVYNPGDKPLKQVIVRNDMVQKGIDAFLVDSNKVRYIFSRYAKTNNGIYSLMDIKSHNIERLIELHNIISEGVHKVEDIEENVDSLFLALMNPEDEKSIDSFQSFSDRINYINLPYVLDINTEVAIYKNIFGRHIDMAFLPRVLHNFARIIIATRMNARSEALHEWVGDPGKYMNYCDKNLQLLKMEIYAGNIPSWLKEDDRTNFTAKRRRKLLLESENEGQKGLSGRDAIRIFNEFYTQTASTDQLINMAMMRLFFTKTHPEYLKHIPKGFIDSMVRMYNYTILQEVKESLYSYNDRQIARDIKNYLFAISFEPGTTQTCTYTKEKLEITESFFSSIENRLLGLQANEESRHEYRKLTQKTYTTETLTQEILIHNRSISRTKLFKELKLRYIHNLKEKVLDPFLKNENFRNCIKAYDTEEFKTYDERIREDVTHLLKNLSNKFNYTQSGAKEMCIYVIDQNVANQFSTEGTVK
ncbi:serine protein kinase PrkA [bacterium]|nr:serine protein kinase PrkA [bacterium]